MPAKDLGTKHACFKCGTKFYDMKKTPAICPKCGADQRESPALKPAPAERRARAAARPVEPVDEVEVEELDEDAEVDEEVDEAADDDDA
jgi:uncharacterized protein (TIGR02300 family)